MDDVRGDFLGPPHGTTPAAVIANKIYLLDPSEAVKHSKREGNLPKVDDYLNVYLYILHPFSE